MGIVDKPATTWFASGCLPFEMAHAAIKYYNSREEKGPYNRLEFSSLADALYHGFVWCYTEEGSSFWTDVHDYIVDIDNPDNYTDTERENLFRVDDYYGLSDEMREKLERWVAELRSINENE